MACHGTFVDFALYFSSFCSLLLTLYYAYGLRFWTGFFSLKVKYGSMLHSCCLPVMSVLLFSSVKIKIMDHKIWLHNWCGKWIVLAAENDSKMLRAFSFLDFIYKNVEFVIKKKGATHSAYQKETLYHDHNSIRILKKNLTERSDRLPLWYNLLGWLAESTL